MTIYGMLRSVFQEGGPVPPIPEGTRDGVPAPRKKVCTKCKQEKPITDFYKRESSTYGFKSECKSCYKSRYMGRGKSDKEEHPEHTQATVPSGMVPTETKVCTICKQEKPVTDFHKSSRNKSGRRAECKSCDKEYKRRRYRARRTEEGDDSRINKNSRMNDGYDYL